MLPLRKRGRAVEGSSLENCRRGDLFVSSNLTASARKQRKPPSGGFFVAWRKRGERLRAPRVRFEGHGPAGPSRPESPDCCPLRGQLRAPWARGQHTLPLTAGRPAARQKNFHSAINPSDNHINLHPLMSGASLLESREILLCEFKRVRFCLNEMKCGARQ